MIGVRDMRYQYQITQVPKNEIGDKQNEKNYWGIVFFNRSSDSSVFWFCWLAKFGCQPLVTDSGRAVPLFTLENLLKKDYKASLMCLIIAFIIANVNFGPFANFKWLGDWSRCASLCRYWLSIS